MRAFVNRGVDRTSRERMRKRKRKQADGGKAPGRARAQKNVSVSTKAMAIAMAIISAFVGIGTSVDGFVVNGIGRRRIAQRSSMTIERDVLAEKDSHLNCCEITTMVSSKKGSLKEVMVDV